MDLGLRNLTDDQLLELLQEACHELGFRDSSVRRLAQDCIAEEAEKLKVAKQAARRAIAMARERWKAELLQELIPQAQQELQEGIDSGEYIPITAAEESTFISEAVRTLNAVAAVNELASWIRDFKAKAEEWLKASTPEQVKQFGIGPETVEQKFEKMVQAAASARGINFRKAFGGSGPFGGKP